MLKYLGSVGAFIRLNDSENKTYNLLNIFSSSVTNNLLFSASVNNLNGSVVVNTASTSIYVDGVSSSVVPSNKWCHLTFAFENKLWTYDTNNFIVRFGDTASSNFNIQNIYILQSYLNNQDVSYIHQEFTGGTNQKITVPVSSSYSINIIDYPENTFTSASTNIIYQPVSGQKRYLLDLSAATENSLSKFVSASVMSNDDLYIDTVNVIPGDYILSLQDNLIYQLTSSSQLITISSSVGDVVRTVSGQYFNNISYLKTNSGFQITPSRVKINYYVNKIPTNNI